VLTSASRGGRFITSKAISISRSNSQVFVASIWSCSLAISSYSFCIWRSSNGSPSFALISL